jgi:hypothetical protein
VLYAAELRYSCARERAPQILRVASAVRASKARAIFMIC